MKRLIAIVALLALTSLSTTAHAQRWEQVGATPDGRLYFLDVSRVRGESGFVRYWVREFKPGGLFSRDRESIASQAADCRKNIYTVTAITERDSSGRVLSQGSRPQSEWQFDEAAPGSVAETLIRRSCDIYAKGYRPSRLALDLPERQDWYPIGMDDDRSLAVDISPQTIKDLGSGVGRVLGRTTYTADQQTPSGSTYKYVIFEALINCAESTYDFSAREMINSSFQLVDAIYKAEDGMVPQKIRPGTMMSQIAVASCAKVGVTSTKAHVPPESESKKGSGSGTGWVVDDSHVVTANHVIAGAKQIVIVSHDRRVRKAQVVVSDPQNDVAVLRTDFGGSGPKPIPLARSLPNLGTKVFTIGFPHPDVLGLSPKLTSGDVSSTSGYRDDPRAMQISVPLQQGNSGGPLLNQAGEAVGMVIEKLNALALYKETQDLPQNINYAVKVRYVQGLLDDAGIKPPATQRTRTGTADAVVTQAREAIVLVIAE